MRGGRRKAAVDLIPGEGQQFRGAGPGAAIVGDDQETLQMVRGLFDQGKGIVKQASGGFGLDTAAEIIAGPARIVGERPFRKLGDPSAVF